MTDAHVKQILFWDSHETDMYDFEYMTDPGNHVFNTITDNCKYYFDEQFNEDVVMKNIFSLIHSNCRSLYTNFPISMNFC